MRSWPKHSCTHNERPDQDVQEGHPVAHHHRRQGEGKGGVELGVALLEKHADVLQLRVLARISRSSPCEIMGHTWCVRPPSTPLSANTAHTHSTCAQAAPGVAQRTLTSIIISAPPLIMAVMTEKKMMDCRVMVQDITSVRLHNQMTV